MNDRDQMPGPGRENPPGPDPDAPQDSGLAASLRNVRNAWAVPGGKLLAAAPAAATLILGVVIGTSVGGSTTTVAVPGPTVYVTPADTTTSQGTSSPAPSSSGDASTAPGATGSVTANPPAPNSTVAGTVSLISLTASNGTWQSTNANPTINGVLQQFAIAQDLPGYTSSGDLGYNLGRHYTKFTGLLGLDDNSPKSTFHPSVEIDGDGLKIASYTPTLGHPAQINVNVAGVLRLDIKYTNTSSDGTNNTEAVLVIGDGQLTTVPGYNPPAPTATR